MYAGGHGIESECGGCFDMVLPAYESKRCIYLFSWMIIITIQRIERLIRYAATGH
jgi:hypothetical protein